MSVPKALQALFGEVQGHGTKAMHMLERRPCWRLEALEETWLIKWFTSISELCTCHMNSVWSYLLVNSVKLLFYAYHVRPLEIMRAAAMVHLSCLVIVVITIGCDNHPFEAAVVIMHVSQTALQSWDTTSY